MGVHIVYMRTHGQTVSSNPDDRFSAEANQPVDGGSSRVF